MKPYKYLVAAGLLAMIATPAMAQQRQSPAPGRGPLSVEAALRMRETLKLSDSQAAQLEALRKEMVAQRQNEAREMIDLESRAAAGLIERDELRKRMESRRDAMRATMEQRRERIERVLTPEQREQIARSRMEMRRAELRRPGRGQGMQRGFDRGPRRPPVPGRYYWF